MMKALFLAVAVGAAAWWFLRRPAPPAPPAPNTVERYGQRLSESVPKAKAAAEAMNEAAKKSAEEARQAVEEAGR